MQSRDGLKNWYRQTCIAADALTKQLAKHFYDSFEGMFPNTMKKIDKRHKKQHRKSY